MFHGPAPCIRKLFSVTQICLLQVELQVRHIENLQNIVAIVIGAFQFHKPPSDISILFANLSSFTTET